jgi:alpha-galactosidase
MRRVTLLFLAVFLAGVGVLSHGQTNLTGYWVFRVPRDNNDGTFHESFFELKQDGEVVTGRALNGIRDNSILEGTFHDGGLRFVMSLPGHGSGEQIQTVYEGKQAGGGKFALTATRPDATQTIGEFVRSTKQAALGPAPQPLPALHDVPDNGLVRTPPMGWNSWNKFHGYVTDADVRGIADAMVASGMAKAGYAYVNVDDTWEGQSRDAMGNITSNKKFPDMKALAAYVHAKGLKIGIYSSPGPKTCAGYEGSFGHEEQDAKQFAIWGFDYLKYDWCSAGYVYRDQDMQAVYQKMGEALLKAGRPIVYSLCQYGLSEVWQWGAKAGANLWRTTGDIADNWISLDQIGFGTQVPGQHTQLEIASFMRPGHLNDPDMLEIGNGGMTDDEYRFHMSLWSLLSAPLLAGNDLRAMSDETKSILLNTEVIAVDQDTAFDSPKRISEPGSSDNSAVSIVLAKTLADGSVAVGMFNRGELPLPMSITWRSLGVTGKTVQVRDVWEHRTVEVSTGGYTADVRKHGVVMLKISTK